MSLKKKDRFKKASDGELQELTKSKVPKNTFVNTRWAITNLTDWFTDYNLRNPENLCPEEVYCLHVPPKYSANGCAFMQLKPGTKAESLIHQLPCTHCCLEF